MLGIPVPTAGTPARQQRAPIANPQSPGLSLISFFTLSIFFTQQFFFSPTLHGNPWLILTTQHSSFQHRSGTFIDHLCYMHRGERFRLLHRRPWLLACPQRTNCPVLGLYRKPYTNWSYRNSNYLIVFLTTLILTGSIDLG